MFQSPVWLEIVLIIALVLLNGVFAMSEMALVSVRKSRLEQRARAGSRGAQRALYLTRHQTRFLSTVQVGITAIGVLAGAYGGASLAAHLDIWFERFPALAEYSEGLALAIVVAGITFLSLVLGELVPKRVALEYPEAIASLLSRPMHAISIAVSPIVRLLTATTEAVLRLLRFEPASDAAVTEEDITALIEQGAASGALEEEEAGMVGRVFRLGDQRAGALMTPRPQVCWLDRNDSTEEHLRRLQRYRHARYPVADGDIDHVMGVVRTVDLLAQLAAGGPLDIDAVLAPPLYVPSSLPATRLLERFRETGAHFAVVVDEHGGVDGIVTLNDLLEEIAGDAEPEWGPALVRRDDGSWLVDASLPWADVATELGIDAPPRGDYETAGGFVLSHLGQIPKAGQSFDTAGYRFEIVDMDGRRIDKLLIARLADEASS